MSRQLEEGKICRAGAQKVRTGTVAHSRILLHDLAFCVRFLGKIVIVRANILDRKRMLDLNFEGLVESG